ncbi:MAG: hemin uptake protein HemP [Rhodoferax sp.]
MARASQPESNASDTLQSTDLFKGQKSVVIEHNGSSYRLQTTRLGKLILTK